MNHLHKTLNPFKTMPKRLFSSKIKHSKYDAVIVGGGHNGLTSAAYLSKAGKKVLVVERRHIIGGAAVTEEIVPGFHFTRGSYCLSLLRPVIMKELSLLSNGLEILSRNPSTFSPLLDGRYLMLGSDDQFNYNEISKFSKKDADAYPKYEEHLERLFKSFDPLIDLPPFDPMNQDSFFAQSKSVLAAWKSFSSLGKEIPQLLEIMTAPATRIINRWFESEPLRSKLATDAVTGAFMGPSTPGSGYVLFHHCMGDIGYGRGTWAYVKGGMGAVSNSIARAATLAGAEIVTHAPVKSFIINDSLKATGVVLEDGTEIKANIILSNCDPHVTFCKLMSPSDVITKSKDDESVSEFFRNIKSYDFSSATFKINLALKQLPSFKCFPNKQPNEPGPQHFGTTHFLENTQQLDEAFQEALNGKPSSRPFVEMTLPSSMDPTISPPGKHVATLFIQYAPYKLANGSWNDPGRKEDFAKSCYKVIEEYAPGFTESIIGEDILSPLDLESVFGLTGGNIFHGAMGLDQIYWSRPVVGWSRYHTPINGLFLCGSGAHPGGGVMGASGRNAAMVALSSKLW